VLSCPDAIAKVLASAAQVNLTDQSEDGVTMGSCPDCGGSIDHEGGCAVCRACGFSRCS
jgi:ribonucleoside-diphosphate reductase alpha chain